MSQQSDPNSLHPFTALLLLLGIGVVGATIGVAVYPWLTTFLNSEQPLPLKVFVGGISASLAIVWAIIEFVLFLAFTGDAFDDTD
jgi:hypothetical protein